MFPSRRLPADTVPMPHLARALLLSFVLHGVAFALPASQRFVAGMRADVAATRHQAALTVNLFPPAAATSPQEKEIPRASAAPASTVVMPAAVATAAPDNHLGPTPAYFPAKALSRLPEALTDFVPDVPATADASGGGRLELRLWLDREGHIDRIQLLKTELPDTLGNAALGAFGRMRFRPAEIQGSPVASWSDVIVEFDAVSTPGQYPVGR